MFPVTTGLAQPVPQAPKVAQLVPLRSLVAQLVPQVLVLVVLLRGLLAQTAQLALPELLLPLPLAKTCKVLMPQVRPQLVPQLLLPLMPTVPVVVVLPRAGRRVGLTRRRRVCRALGRLRPSQRLQWRRQRCQLRPSLCWLLAPSRSHLPPHSRPPPALRWRPPRLPPSLRRARPQCQPRQQRRPQRGSRRVLPRL